MAVKIVARTKDPAAVALGRKGGKKGGLARAARLTAQQRSESARRAVTVRWDKVKERRARSAAINKVETSAGVSKKSGIVAAANTNDTSDQALMVLLKRLRSAKRQDEVRRLSDQIERAIFHKQYERT